ncbi:MAG: cobalt-precorrin 5A hydrolase [Oscillospiraceae bacterium]
MKTACFYLTEQGRKTAEKICDATGGVLYGKENFKDNVRECFDSYETLVFVMASGIVIRTIAPLIKSKTTDPAVILVSQDGRYAISLLSGHLGGANEETKRIAEFIGAQAVITTATDVQNVVSFDVFAKKNNLAIENIDNLKYISSSLLDGNSIDLISDIRITGVPEYINFSGKYENEYAVCISDKIADDTFHKKVLFLRPKDIVIGIGCKKNISADYLDSCFHNFLENNRLSIHSVKCISTIELKKNEPALLELGRKYNLELRIADLNDIEEHASCLEQSEFVMKVTGVPSVAEGSAYIISEKGEKIQGKTKFSGITMAAYRISLPDLEMES